MKKFIHLFIIFVLLSSSAIRAFDLQSFMADTQRIKQGSGNITLVWWIPSAFWEETLRQNKDISERQRQQFIAVLEPYLLFVLLRADVSPFGSLKGRARSELLDAFDPKFDGKTISTIEDRALPPDVKNLLAMFKPIIAGMLGQMGEGLEFIVLSNSSKDGRKTIDPMKPGTIDTKFFDAQFRWRLPLGSLLPPMIDSKTNETFPGNYQFNPFTGDKLTRKKE